MKKDRKRRNELVVQPERSQFQYMLAENPNYFGNIPGSNLKPKLKLISNTTYEQLTCVGYNPDTRNMEATFSIKRSTGYSGNLCTAGSFEHVRFYMDFHDGAGFIDQGSVRVNVHDIPADKDCANKSIFPISYVATLRQEKTKFNICKDPVLPTLRAILSWNNDPPVNSPDWKPVWGSVMECDVQLRPFLIFFPIDPVYQLDLSKYLELASDAPNLTSQQISEVAGVDLSKLKQKTGTLSLIDLVEKSRAQEVPASRFAYKAVQKMIQYPTSEITMLNKEILQKAQIDLAELLDEYGKFFPVDTSKANVSYEELECVGLDYNTESLVATLKIKKNFGYSGDLCDDGSNEYVSFWIDWKDKCQWNYLDTVKLNVHDIEMKGDHLCYSVSLPLDAMFYRKICSKPNVVRVRAVLSWNTPPSTTDPNKLEYYGNRVDSHVQIKPGISINPGDVIPLFNIIGGIDVAHVNDMSGLTKPGSFFAFNGNSVPAGAPFGGKIVINGPSFPGYRYRIKVTNLNTGTVSYLNNSFTVVGHLLSAPWVQYTTQQVDSAGYYPFLAHDENTLNVLARFTPGTNDKLRVEIEVDTIPGVFGKTIQMDNIKPEVVLQVDDGGDCTHYKKGDTITGHFYVNDKHIRSWRFSNTWTGQISGTSNTPGVPGTAFSINTPLNAHPCGAVSLWAEDKTIVNSQAVGHEAWASYNVCLKED